MGYVKQTLAPGEIYVYRAFFHWLYDVQSWFWLFVGITPITFWAWLQVSNHAQAEHFGRFFIGISTLAAILGVWVCISRFVNRWTTVVAVTSVRLVHKRGLISRDAEEITLDKIEEIVLHQGFFGRILNYGTLHVQGTGVSEIDFPTIEKPMVFRRKIEEAIVAFRRG